jgi:hypothetical protein
MTDIIKLATNEKQNAGDWLTELGSELKAENDPTMKVCVVVVNYDGEGMFRLRARKTNASLLEAVGMLETAKADFTSAD